MAWFAIATVMTAACGGSADGGSATGSASASIGSQTYAVNKVEFTFEPGEDGHFSIAGDDAANPEKDCVPGLNGGLALYGDLPAGVTTMNDLAGRELPFEFSGDGDDFNLCFVGTNGLLGVETGTVEFTAVNGNTVAFTFSGSFKVYDGDGGESGPVEASGSGTAVAAAR